jgi:hypothetical protein
MPGKRGKAAKPIKTLFFTIRMARDPAAEFKTHANYLRAFAHLTCGGSGFQIEYSSLAQRVVDSGLLYQRADVADADLEQVRKSLSNAWGTEYLLLVGETVGQDNELVALANNWSVVQAYYVGYHAIQALSVAKKFPRPESHTTTQNQYHNLWNRRTHLAPWTLAATNDGYRVPERVQIDEKLHAWSRCSSGTCFSLACKVLRTTRESVVGDALIRRREAKRRLRRQNWQREDRERLAQGRRPRRGGPPDSLPRLTRREKEEVRAGVRGATLLDYLYRLRIKTNYIDSDMFTDGPSHGDESWQVRTDICSIVKGTMLVHELMLANAVGRERIAAWASDWSMRNIPSSAQLGVAARIGIIREAQ